VSRTVTPDHVKPSEAAILLGRERDTIYTWVRSGKLRAYRDRDGYLYIPIDAIREMLEPVAAKE
jgi:excisionase family DNA binding protein